MSEIFDKLGLIAAVVLPLWNIPMIARIIKRKSSQDISLAWAIGVWVCFALMFPNGLKSPDVVWRTFNIINMVFFTSVVVVTLKYRKGIPS
jgi:uncharacterized protein with PQ loop repeat